MRQGLLSPQGPAGWGVSKGCRGSWGAAGFLCWGRHPAPAPLTPLQTSSLCSVVSCFLITLTGLLGCTCTCLKGAGPTIVLSPFHSESPESVRLVQLACVLVSCGSWVFTFGSLVCGQVGWFSGLRYDHLVLALSLRLRSGWAGTL